MSSNPKKAWQAPHFILISTDDVSGGPNASWIEAAPNNGFKYIIKNTPAHIKVTVGPVTYNNYQHS